MTFPYHLGDTGLAVKAIQTDLRYNGAVLPVDGNFGGETEAAAKQFQHTNGLVVDGICGPVTCRTLCHKRVVDQLDLVPLPRAWMLWGIEGHESSWDYGAVGFHHPADTGLVQINLEGTPDNTHVTLEQAFDPGFAVSYCAQYLRTKLNKYRAAGRHKVVARRAAVCAWHAPRWGDLWGATGVAPNEEAETYVNNVFRVGNDPDLDCGGFGE